MDHEERKLAVLSRPSLQLLTQLKPLDVPRIASYLSRRGLGTWVKLCLRSGSLPLLSMLARHSKKPLDASCKICRSGEAESVLHFVCTCSALASERLELLHSAEADAELAAMPGSTALLRTLRGGSPHDRLLLLLRSVEFPVSNRFARFGVGEDAKSSDALRVSGRRRPTLKASERLTLHFEPLSMRFLVSIWRKRAELLGYVPLLSFAGDSLVRSHLRVDGRCRALAVGTASSSLD